LISLGLSKILDGLTQLSTLLVHKSAEWTYPGAPERLLGQSFQNGAVRPPVTVAINRKMGKRIPHIREFRDPPVQLRDMFERDRLDLCTGALPVLPQRQEFANIVDQKAQSPRLPNEA